jgi:hypothetical protein
MIILFLVMVTFFIGGQTSALSFSVVSSACAPRITLAMVADQLMRMVSLLAGFSMFLKGKSWVINLGISAWIIFRFGTYRSSSVSLISAIAIVATVLVKREFGTVCIPAPDLIPAALGMVLDIVLDGFLVFTSILLLWTADEEERRNYSLLLGTATSLLLWHLVYRLYCKLTYQSPLFHSFFVSAMLPIDSFHTVCSSQY